MNASTSVMGIIAKVLVNFTVTALSNVAEDRLYILSQVEAAEVTDEVSLIAVPAKIPKGSPEVLEKPSQAPKAGNKIAASILKKKITEMACATSSSSASITGAVAAIAEPPQMEEPTPIKVEIFDGICIILCNTYEITSEVVMVPIIIGSDCFPVASITERFKPKPNRTTAYCKILFEVNLIPASNLLLFLINMVMIMPIKIAITGPPIIGKIFPSNHDGIAMIRQSNNPSQLLLIKFISCASFTFELKYFEIFILKSISKYLF